MLLYVEQPRNKKKSARRRRRRPLGAFKRSSDESLFESQKEALFVSGYFTSKLVTYQGIECGQIIFEYEGSKGPFVKERRSGGAASVVNSKLNMN